MSKQITNEIALQTSTVKSLALWQSKVSVYKYAGSRLKYLSLLPSALNVYIYIHIKYCTYYKYFILLSKII